MRLTHLGTATVLLEIGGLRLLTDPAFDPAGGRYWFGWGATSRKLEPPLVDWRTLGSLDAVLLSHHHHLDNLDHAGRALLAADSVSCVVTVRRGLKSLFSVSDVAHKTVGLLEWESHTISNEAGESLTVTAVPALHGIYENWPGFGRRTIGYLVSWPDQRGGPLYISGDTIFFDGLHQIAAHCAPFGGIGTALLHAGGVWFAPLFLVGRHTFDARGFVKACEVLAPQRIIPIHYDGWAHFRVDGDALRREIARHPSLEQRTTWLVKGLATEIQR